MEPQREQQYPPTGYHQNAVPGQYYVTPTPAQQQPMGSIFLRTIRLLLRRFLYVLIRIGRPLKPYAGFLAVIFLLLGVIGWMALSMLLPRAQTVVDSRVTALPPAQAVENYVQGQRSYDAGKMWDSMSVDYQNRQLSRGVSKDNMQARANEEKVGGLKYTKFDYIGGVGTDGDGKMFFYSVKVEYPGQNQIVKLQIPLTIWVDKDEKIMRVMSPLSSDSSSQ